MAKNYFGPQRNAPQSQQAKKEAITGWKRFFKFLEKPQSGGLLVMAKYWFKKIAFYFFASTFTAVIILRFLPIWITPTMLDRKFEAITSGEESEIHYEWKSYEKISKEAALAVVASEDQKFPEHFGLDLPAMWNAFRYNLKGKKIRGASTISQQVAKNVFLWQDRSYIRKVLEFYFTILIEIFWGKERILEVYLNVAEMGKMTFGVEATAQRYFGKSAANINRTEAARIAAILPSPRRYSISAAGPYVQRRTNQVTRQMRALGGTAYLKGM
jgi:monofunctional glycosyltransferase